MSQKRQRSLKKRRWQRRQSRSRRRRRQMASNGARAANSKMTDRLFTVISTLAFQAASAAAPLQSDENCEKKNLQFRDAGELHRDQFIEPTRDLYCEKVGFKVFRALARKMVSCAQACALILPRSVYLGRCLHITGVST